MSQPMSPTRIPCTSVSLNMRKAIFHCVSKANILYLGLIWPIASSIQVDRSQDHEVTNFQVEITNVLEILIQFTIRGP